MFKTNKTLTFSVSLTLVIFVGEQILKAVFAVELILLCAAVEFLYTLWEICVKIGVGNV